MTYARTSIQDFSTANPIYGNAIVTAYKVVDGAKTNIKADLYANISGSTKLANPQTMDAYGKFKQPVYIDAPVILTVTGLSNTPDHDTGIIDAGRMFDVVISSAQILALHTTPKNACGRARCGKGIGV